MRIAIPMDLAPYIRIRDGEIIFKKELPDSLKEALEIFKSEYDKIVKANTEGKK